MQSTPVPSTRTRCLVLALGLASFLTPQMVMGAAPVNDLCGAAHVIPPTLSSSNVYFAPIITTIADATVTGDPSLETCVVSSELSRSVWYQFTPATTGGYTFSTGPDTASTLTAFDPIIAVYQSTGCGAPFTLVACNDDTGGGIHNLAGVHVELTSGVSYYAVIWMGGVTDYNQPLSLQLKVSRPQVPANDGCAGAMLVNNSFPYASPVVDISLANTTPGITLNCAPAQGIPSRDIWFRFQPPATGTYILSTGADTATTVDDTLMAIFSGDCGNLTPVICNDNGIGRASLSVSLNQGTTYFIVLYEVLEELGEFTPGHTSMQLRIGPASAPSVTSIFASRIASTNVFLHGTVNPNGLQTRFWFEWGPTTGLGSTSQVRLILGGTADLVTNLNVTGFAPNTTYHFRMIATNIMGRSVTPETGTFRWSSVPPQISVFQRPTANRAYLRFDNGNPAQLYSVQSATQLAPPNSWTNVGFAANPAAGPSNVFEFNHTGIGANPQRFYRVYLP